MEKRDTVDESTKISKKVEKLYKQDKLQKIDKPIEGDVTKESVHKIIRKTFTIKERNDMNIYALSYQCIFLATKYFESKT